MSSIEVDQKKALMKRKICKDFSFLLKIEKEMNCRYAKYLIKEGQGELIKDISQNFDIVYSLNEYDYEGKLILHYDQGKIGKHDQQKVTLLQCLMSMKVHEKSWFNCFQFIVDSQKIDDFGEQEELNEPEEEEQKCGVHYEITLLRLQFKNDEGMQIKRKVFEQKREEGKNKFLKKQYYEACKIYKFMDDITVNFQKKNYEKQQIIELNQMNQKAKVNFMKCFFKIIETKGYMWQDIQKHAEKIMQILVKKKDGDAVLLFLHAKWLLKERYLDNAYRQAEKSYKVKNTKEAIDLMNLIREEKKNKGKLKIAVTQEEKT